MRIKAVSGIVAASLLMGVFCTALNVRLVASWSNGGYSADPSNPDYGTHDWIAQHALDWLPPSEKQYILGSLAAYLYGTELPDNAGAPDGIGDTTKHHIYYWSDGSLQDDASAVRASEEYYATLNCLKSGDFAAAAKTAGIMSHYIVDMAVYGHVMGAQTDWGSETHHSDYETYLNQRTSSYDAEFNIYLSFDNDLSVVSAYDAAKELAYDTTFDGDGDLTCVWMDENYDWSNPIFKNRAGESLNLAVNCLTDVLHTLYSEALQPRTWTVDDNGPADFSIIQDAMGVANPGDTILVSSGTYNERLVVNKTVNLMGENKHTTIIDAKGTGTTVLVTSANVNISGFTIRNGKTSDLYPNVGWGIKGGFRISDNIVENNDNGIGDAKWVANNIVRNNGRMFTVNTGYGISTGDATIEQNEIYNNYYGIAAFGSTIKNNEIFANGIGSPGYYYDGAGILDVVFVTGGYNNITFNTLKENYVGISLSIYGRENVIYKNNFVDNQKQVSGWLSSNVYDNGAEGNYWSDYQGIDANGDGIGDTLLPHLNIDEYPLIELWSDVRKFNAYTWKGVDYKVKTLSNNTIASFRYDLDLKYVSFNVTGPSDRRGSCNVTIPKSLLIGEPWLLLIDGVNITSDAIITEDNTETVLCFSYSFSTHKIKIMGTEALDIISPAADAGTDQIVDEDTLVTFDGSNSLDNVGIIDYTWIFLDLTSQILNGVDPTYIFTTPGTYIITLNVSDAIGNYDTDTVTISVKDVTNPTADAGSDLTVNVGQTVTFEGADSSDNVGIVSYEWDFGDGTTGTGITTTYAYTTPGTYTVTLTVRDAAGNADTDSLTVTVREAAIESFPLWVVGIIAALIASIVLAIAVYFSKKKKPSPTTTSP